MRDLLILNVHLITTVLRLAKPGGLVAESFLVKPSIVDPEPITSSVARSPHPGDR
jgi:hypothetical protein